MTIGKKTEDGDRNPGLKTENKSRK